MNDEKFMILEVNLINTDELVNDINKVLDDKGVAQFSGSDKNVVRNWFNTHYIKAIKNGEIDLKSSINRHVYKSDEPEWMKKSDVMDYSGSLPKDVVDEIVHIVDYFTALDINNLRKINKEPYKIISNKVKEWDESLSSKVNDNEFEDSEKAKLKLNKDYSVVAKIGSFSVVRLLTPESTTVEGEVMGHCVGGEDYGSGNIYSIWDSENRSHVTIETDEKKKAIFQIKGKQNKAPAKKYQSVSVEFVASLMLNKYKVKSDGENIGMVKHNNDYHFDDIDILPKKYQTLPLFRQWVDIIYPTEIYPKQQQVINNIIKRIKIVD